MIHRPADHCGLLKLWFVSPQFYYRIFPTCKGLRSRNKRSLLQFFCRRSFAKCVVSPPSVPLPRNQVHIWLSSVSKHKAESLFNILSLEEKRKCEQFLSSENRDTFIVGRGVIRTALSKYLKNCEPGDLTLETLEGGKPVFIGNDASIPKISFSLSHTKELCALAVSCDGEIGIDVENKNRQVKRYLDLAKKYFAESELSWLLRQPSHKQRESFLCIWTLKESFVKATGEGIAKGSLKSFQLDTEALDKRLQSLYKLVVGNYSRPNLQYLLLDTIDTVFIAVSTTCPQVEKVVCLDMEGNCIASETVTRNSSA